MSTDPLAVQRKEAEILHRRVRNQESSAIDYVRKYHPKLRDETESEIIKMPFADALLVIARQYGKESWSAWMHDYDNDGPGNDDMIWDSDFY